MSKKVKVGVIAAGARSQLVVKNLLRDSREGVEIAAVYDPDRAEAELACREWASPDCRICASAEEVIAVPGVEWIMVFSPNARHRGHIEAAFAAGKHVFSEKPLATTIEDCQAIHEAHRRHPELHFATGFVLRYAPLYRKAKELLSSGVLGRLLMIQANENIAPVHGGYMMGGWRRLTRDSGPHLLEKCCHDFDLIDWFCESRPRRVSGFGRLAFFTPENEELMQRYGAETFTAWRDPHRQPSPFTCDKDVIDTQGASIEMRSGVIVSFMATMSNPKPERRMYFSCTEGTMIVELYSLTLTWRCMGASEEQTIRFDGDCHGGGDSHIMKALYRTMTEGTPPECSGDEGLESAVFALAVDQAIREERIVDLEPIWQKLER